MRESLFTASPIKHIRKQERYVLQTIRLGLMTMMPNENSQWQGQTFSASASPGVNVAILFFLIIIFFLLVFGISVALGIGGLPIGIIVGGCLIGAYVLYGKGKLRYNPQGIIDYELTNYRALIRSNGVSIQGCPLIKCTGVSVVNTYRFLSGTSINPIGGRNVHHTEKEMKLEMCCSALALKQR